MSLGETEKQLEIRQVQDELSANGYSSRFIRKVPKKTQITETKEDNQKKKKEAQYRRDSKHSVCSRSHGTDWKNSRASTDLHSHETNEMEVVLHA